MIKLIISITFLVSVAVLASKDAPEVKIEQGTVRGKYDKTWKGNTFSAFTGIPYAKPPVGDLRFKPPVPAESWKGIFDASKSHPMCTQINVFLNDHTVRGQEDCLYLNVYSPQLPNSGMELLPVILFIHGGGFMCGKADWYGPEILLDKDVILVTPNYRVGALGFISTGDEVVPGNNGLKDQNLALKWTKQNIARFGGDPERITIFGQSAGGASAHYHMLSPLSRDLINGAILHSGSAFGSWSFAPKGQGVRNTKKLAEFLNCPTGSNQEMIECMRKVDVQEIVAQDVKFLEWNYDPMVAYKPVVEPNIAGAFLAEDPIDIIKSGKAANVPIMTGLTTEDGAIKSALLYNDSNLIEELNKDFNRIAPILMQYGETAPDKDHVSKQIREFYFGNRQIDVSTKDEVTNMITDSWFLVAEDAAVQLHSKYSKQPVYYFLFGYRGSNTFGSLFGNDPYDYGACHCDELLYLFNFDLFFPNYKPNESDKKMIDVLTTLWKNFAKTGKPTPENDPLFPTKWNPVQSEQLEYYFIKSNTDMKMAKNMYLDRVKFWRDLPTDSRRTEIRDEL